MIRLIVILSLAALTALAQERVITKDYLLNDSEIILMGLQNLEAEHTDINYRIWIEPDLVIEVGNDVTLILYMTNYDKKKGYGIENVERIRLDSDSWILLKHFDSLQLNNWKDAKKHQDGYVGSEIMDGHRVLIEFSSREKYRAFSLYGPLTDKSMNSHKTLELLNFIAHTVNPDEYRIKYYDKYSEANKKAKRRLKEITYYKQFLKKEIVKDIFPAMWGVF